MLSRLSRAVAEIDASLAQYQYSPYAQSLYDLLWRDFCDWYLEAIKPTVGSDPSQRAVLRATFDTILRLLHPVLPFVTEAVYEHIRAIEAADVSGVELSPGASGMLCTASWPIVSAALIDDDAETQFDHLRLLVEEIRQIRAKHSVVPKRRVTLHCTAKELDAINNGSGIVETIAGLESVTTDPPPTAAVVFSLGSGEYHLSNLADEMDRDTERDRLGREIEGFEKQVANLTGRLSNKAYVDKAPTALVEQTHDQLKSAKAELMQARARLAELIA